MMTVGHLCTLKPIGHWFAGLRLLGFICHELILKLGGFDRLCISKLVRTGYLRIQILPRYPSDRAFLGRGTSQDDFQSSAELRPDASTCTGSCWDCCRVKRC